MLARAFLVALTAVTVLAPAGIARAQESGSPSAPERADVDANGNAFTGGLEFFPDAVTVRVGGVVRWLNTDFLVPHTATEDHGLWDLGGTYGATPANPSGFGPGESVQRMFEAGTAKYYCRVHPTTMRGTVTVPVRLSLARRRVVTKRRVRSRRTGRVRTVRRVRTRYFVDATWAAGAPASGRVFDVELKRDARAWQALLTGTTETGARVSAGARRGAITAVRARLRLTDNPSAATGWSPDASVARP
jgi:plastocyanin